MDLQVKDASSAGECRTVNDENNNLKNLLCNSCEVQNHVNEEVRNISRLSPHCTDRFLGPSIDRIRLDRHSTALE